MATWRSRVGGGALLAGLVAALPVMAQVPQSVGAGGSGASAGIAPTGGASAIAPAAGSAAAGVGGAGLNSNPAAMFPSPAAAGPGLGAAAPGAFNSGVPGAYGTPGVPTQIIQRPAHAGAAGRRSPAPRLR